MISKPTVFVLGAGASCPYGFPSAFAIVQQICDEVSSRGPVTWALEKCGFTEVQISDFCLRVKQSGQYSIDAFLQRHGPPPTLRRMGKISVVAQLAEDDTALRLQPESADWMRFLFTRMFPPSADAFEANKLQVITFNFDRSFERRLFSMLKHSYPIEDAEAARLVKAIPVIHVHGQLGDAEWLENGAGRPYAKADTAEDLGACADAISLVDDEIPKVTIEKVQSILADPQIDRICFIGFSFHRDNLARLNVGRELGRKTIYGTCHEMSEADVSRVYRVFNSPRQNYLLNRTARDFFNVVDLFS